jgi:hypothetical protein
MGKNPFSIRYRTGGSLLTAHPVHLCVSGGGLTDMLPFLFAHCRFFVHLPFTRKKCGRSTATEKRPPHHGILPEGRQAFPFIFSGENAHATNAMALHFRKLLDFVSLHKNLFFQIA